MVVIFLIILLLLPPSAANPTSNIRPQLPPSATHIMSSNPGLHNFLGKHSVYDILGAKPKPDDPDHIPMNYNSVFTNLGNLHNTRAVITAKIHLDLQSALNFCQLFRFAWPKSLPARTAALMSASNNLHTDSGPQGTEVPSPS